MYRLIAASTANALSIAPTAHVYSCGTRYNGEAVRTLQHFRALVADATFGMIPVQHCTQTASEPMTISPVHTHSLTANGSSASPSLDASSTVSASKIATGASPTGERTQTPEAYTRSPNPSGTHCSDGYSLDARLPFLRFTIDSRCSSNKKKPRGVSKLLPLYRHQLPLVGRDAFGEIRTAEHHTIHRAIVFSETSPPPCSHPRPSCGRPHRWRGHWPAARFRYRRRDRRRRAGWRCQRASSHELLR